MNGVLSQSTTIPMHGGAYPVLILHGAQLAGSGNNPHFHSLYIL